MGGPLLLTDPAVESSAAAPAVGAVAVTASQVDGFGGPEAISAGVYSNLVVTVHGVEASF